MQTEKCWLIGLGRSGTIQLLCIRSDYCFIVQLDCCSVFILIFGSFSTLFCIYPLSKLYVLRFFTAWVLISLLAFCEEVSAICAHDFDILLFLMRYFCQLCNLFVFWPFVFFFNLRVGAKPGLGGPARPGKPGSGKGRVFFFRGPLTWVFLSQCVSPRKNRWFRNAFLRPAQCSTSGWQTMFLYYYFFSKNVSPQTQSWRGLVCDCWRWTAPRMVSNYCCHWYGSHSCYQPETWKQNDKAEVKKWCGQPVKIFARMVSWFRERT